MQCSGKCGYGLFYHPLWFRADLPSTFTWVIFNLAFPFYTIRLKIKQSNKYKILLSSLAVKFATLRNSWRSFSYKKEKHYLQEIYVAILYMAFVLPSYGFATVQSVNLQWELISIGIWACPLFWVTYRAAAKNNLSFHINHIILATLPITCDCTALPLFYLVRLTPL